MPCAQKSGHGFTLLEVLVVVSIIAILALALSSAYGIVRRRVRVATAENTLKSISFAMESYKSDFNAYPPDDTPGSNGSETLWYYLCRVHQVGEMHRGPYLQSRDDQLKDAGSGSNRKFTSPLGGDYEYALLVDPDGARRMYMLVDPGLDKELGGKLSRREGFIQSNAQKAKDNLVVR